MNCSTAGGAGTRIRERLAAARLYVLIPGGPSPSRFAALVRSLIETGVDVLQLRDNTLGDRILVERARLLRELTRGTSTLFVVNDRPDIAVLTNADAVHVGQHDLSVHDVRAITGPAVPIGVSTHSLPEARQAALDGADYLGCGPVFPSGTKGFRRFPGPELLRQVSRETDLPAFAIGGISSENVKQVLDAGFTRVAVAGAVAHAKHPAAAARSLLRGLGRPD